jgi:hypothetical protein
VSRQTPHESPDPPDSLGDEAPDAGGAADAALDAVEPERLLPGEEEDSVHLDDAVHWTKVYSELLDFKRSLLTVAEDRIISMNDVARTEVEKTDLKILQAEAQRLERRQAFWRVRSVTLTDRLT